MMELVRRMIQFSIIISLKDTLLVHLYIYASEKDSQETNNEIVILTIIKLLILIMKIIMASKIRLVMMRRMI